VYVSDSLEGRTRRFDKNHYLYIAVVVAVVVGAVLGLAAPQFAAGLEPIGTGFVALIKMMISPIIFCTIVIGVGSIAKAATVHSFVGYLSAAVPSPRWPFRLGLS
jgi:aerobic C4-dicarboxylate transport protein